MKKSEVISGLKSLIKEANYQIESDKLHDEIFEQDLEVLTIALECVEKYYEGEQDMNKQETIKEIRELIEDKKRLLEGDDLDFTFEYDIEVLKKTLKLIEREPKGVWVATMSSETYDWTGVGQTEDEAINAIVTEWNKSEWREKMTREELEDEYCIWCEFIEYGKCEWQ